MNRKSSIVMSFTFITFFSIAAFAQTQPPAKIAVLDTNAFYDEKTGITKLLNVYKQLAVEFKPVQDELTALNTKLKTLENEIRAGQTAKTDEYEKLNITTRMKSEDAQVRYNKRQSALFEPISRDIGSVIVTFSRQKGITLVLDLSKIQGILWSLESTDMTKEFIAFYNAR